MLSRVSDLQDKLWTVESDVKSVENIATENKPIYRRHNHSRILNFQTPDDKVQITCDEVQQRIGGRQKYHAHNSRWWGLTGVIWCLQTHEKPTSRLMDFVNRQAFRQDLLEVNRSIAKLLPNPFEQNVNNPVAVHNLSLINCDPPAFVALSQKLSVCLSKGAPVLFPLFVPCPQIGRFLKNLLADVHGVINACNFNAIALQGGGEFV